MPTACPARGLSERENLFVRPGEPVCAGQIVAEHCRENDIEVNVCRGRGMTNICTATADKTLVLRPPHEPTLELALKFVEENDPVEYTPDALRLRIRLLSETDRRRAPGVR